MRNQPATSNPKPDDIEQAAKPSSQALTRIRSLQYRSKGAAKNKSPHSAAAEDAGFRVPGSGAVNP